MYKNKLVVILLIFTSFLFANESKYDNFENNCKSCHFAKKQMDMFMFRYTLKYSSEDKIKNAIFEYLKNPKIENSVMPRGFLNRFGVKEKISLEDDVLLKSNDEYYELYNVKDRIK
jgi:hypothetical protein